MNAYKGMPLLLVCVALAELSVADGMECAVGNPLKSALPGGMVELRCMRDMGENIFSQDGPYMLLYKNGQTSIRASFKGGVPHGAWISFYKNGVINEEGAYCGGQKIGVWRRWNEAGELEETKDYR